MSEPELRECPFCGATEPMVEVQIESSYYCVSCNGCGCAALWHVVRAEAIDAWNRRAPQPRWEPLPDGEILNSNGLHIEIEAASGGWLLRFGKNGAHVWFPDTARLCRRKPSKEDT